MDFNYQVQQTNIPSEQFYYGIAEFLVKVGLGGGGDRWFTPHLHIF